MLRHATLNKPSFLVATAGFVCLTAGVHAQTISWGTLTWDDFQGQVPPSTPWAAETWSGADGSWDGTKPLRPAGGQKKAGLKDVRASSSFDKGKSWVKPDQKTDKLLQHEQYHFDITEYWARELEKGLRGVVGCGTTQQKANDDAEAKGNAAKAKCAEDCKKLQEKYDTETDHGRKEDKQKEWCEKVGALLDVCQAPPPKTGGKTEEPKKMYFDPDSNAVFFDPIQLDSFVIGDAAVNDDALVGATVLLPPLQFGGDYMPDSMAMILPTNPEESQVVIVSTAGEILAKGNVRLIMASDHEPQLTGSLEGLIWTDAALRESKVVAAIESELLNPSAFMTIRLDTFAHLRDATDNFSQPAVIDMQATVGVTSCWPANPPIFGQPGSQAVPRGGVIKLDVFAPVVGDLAYQWYFDGKALRDDERIRGALARELTISGALPTDAGRYSVIVRSGCGESSSETAKVTVGPVGTVRRR